MDTLKLKPSYAPSIYSESKQKTVFGSITLEDDILRYFLNIPDKNTDYISVDTTLLTETSDKSISFDFDVYSERAYTLGFIDFTVSQYPVWRGLTKFKVTKYAGSSKWDIKLLSADYVPSEERVFEYEDLIDESYYEFDRISGNFGDIFGQGDVNVFHGSSRLGIIDNRKVYMHSSRSILLQKLQMNVNTDYNTSYDYPAWIKIYGSNDEENWILIGEDLSPRYTKGKKFCVLTNNIENTFFKHFRVDYGVGSSQTNCNLPYTFFFGIKAPYADFKYKRIFPYLTQTTQGDAVAILDMENVSEKNYFPNGFFVNHLRQFNFNAAWKNNDKSRPITIFIKASDEAKIPALFGLVHADASNWRAPNYWKLYGSNTETMTSEDTTETIETFKAKNWTLLACTQKLGGYYRDAELEYKKINSEAAYKYYKFEVVTTYNADKGVYIAGAMLYSKDYSGDLQSFDNFIPLMRSTSQEGYIISCSNESDGDVKRAFDRDENTHCGGAFANGSWDITVKMANKVKLNAVSIKAPNADATRTPRDFVIEASEDSENWIQLLEVNSASIFVERETRAWTFENNTAYLWYRLRVTASHHATNVRIGELSIGRSEKLPTPFFYEEERIVPVMNSENQDGYIVTASGYNAGGGNYVPWKAFNENQNGWGIIAANAWLKIELPVAKPVTNMEIVNLWGGGEEVKNFTLSGSNDDTNYTQIIRRTGIVWNGGEGRSFEFADPVAYKFYKLDISRDNADWMGVAKLMLRNIYKQSQTVFPGEPITKRLISPATAMTSDEQDGFKTSASGVWNGNGAPAFKAFDGQTGDNNNWQSAGMTDANNLCNEWLQIELPKARVCNFIRITPRTSAVDYCKYRNPKAFVFKGSNDGNIWTDLLTVTDVGSCVDPTEWEFENSTEYKFYRIVISETYRANDNVNIGDLQLYRKF